jgi:hypothetical protein
MTIYCGANESIGLMVGLCKILGIDRGIRSLSMNLHSREASTVTVEYILTAAEAEELARLLAGEPGA